MDESRTNNIQMTYAGVGNLRLNSYRVVRVPVTNNISRIRYLDGTSDVGNYRLWGITDGEEAVFDPASQGEYFETPLPPVEGEIVRNMGDILVFPDGRIFVKSEAVDKRNDYKRLKALAVRLFASATSEV